MHRLGFYARFASSNLIRNKDTYLPYLLACIVSISTFYTLLAINFNDSVGEMRGEAIVASFTMIGTVLLGIFCIILFFYTNSFLIKRRKREIGLYSILGMEKKNIGYLMFFETVIIAGVAIVLGLVAGALGARLMYLILLRLIQFPVMIDLPVSYTAMGISVVFFGAVFLLTLFSNLRQVRIVSPVELMAGAKQGEKEPKSSIIITLIGLVALAGGYGIALVVKAPVDAIVFFLFAAILVIIGTYCLFTSGSIAFLKRLRRNKNYYYQPNHFISVSGMLYRMKRNAAGLASICILSCMVLVTVSATITLYIGAEDSLKQRYPEEFRITLTDVNDNEIALAGIEELAEKNGLTIQNMRNIRSFYTVTVKGENGYSTADDLSSYTGVYRVEIIPLVDFNTAEGKQEQLAQGEALLLYTGENPKTEQVKINGIEYYVRLIDTFGTQKMGDSGAVSGFVLVVPEMADLEAAIEALPSPGKEAVIERNITFETEGDSLAKTAFYEDFKSFAVETPTSGLVYIESRDAERGGWYATNGGFLFLGMYFGIIFMMAAAMIIYYKQISEGSEDADRFEILQKVGMGEAEVRKTIKGQVRTVFFLPLIVAILHIIVAFNLISKGMYVFGVYNTPLMILSTIATVLLYGVIYWVVYSRTARTYYKMVRWEP